MKLKRPLSATPYGLLSAAIISMSVGETRTDIPVSASASFASRNTRSRFMLVSSSSETPMTAVFSPIVAKPATRPAGVSGLAIVPTRPLVSSPVQATTRWYSFRWAQLSPNASKPEFGAIGWTRQLAWRDTSWSRIISPRGLRVGEV